MIKTKVKVKMCTNTFLYCTNTFLYFFIRHCMIKTKVKVKVKMCTNTFLYEFNKN